MNDNVEGIVEIIALLFFLGVMLVPFIVFFIYVFYQTSKRKKIRERTQNAYGHMIGSNRALAIKSMNHALDPGSRFFPGMAQVCWFLRKESLRLSVRNSMAHRSTFNLLLEIPA